MRWIDNDKTLIVRTARKRYQCCVASRPVGAVRQWDGGPLPPRHTGWISPGERHVEYVGESHAFESGKRYCLPCCEAIGWEV